MAEAYIAQLDKAERVSATHRDARRSAAALLRRRGLSPGLSAQSSRSAVHRHQRSAQGAQFRAACCRRCTTRRPVTVRGAHRGPTHAAATPRPAGGAAMMSAAPKPMKPWRADAMTCRRRDDVGQARHGRTEDRRSTCPSSTGATGWLNSKPLTRDEPARQGGGVRLLDLLLHQLPARHAVRERLVPPLQGCGPGRSSACTRRSSPSRRTPRTCARRWRNSTSSIPWRSTATWRSGRPSTTASGRRTISSTRRGKIRGHHFGEGKYARSERTIRQLLTEAGAKNLPDPLDDAAGEGVSAAADTANVASPETYLGFARAENFLSPGSFARNGVKNYHAAPTRWRSINGRWAVAGRSAAKERALEAAPGRIVFRFRARDLHLVLGPGARAGKPVRFRVAARWQAAGRRSRHGRRREGQSARCASNGCTSSSARRARSSEHEFTIEFLDPDVEAYSFTFG